MTEELFKQQKLNSDETVITQQSVPESHLAELQEKIQQTEATNKVNHLEIIDFPEDVTGSGWVC